MTYFARRKAKRKKGTSKGEERDDALVITPSPRFAHAKLSAINSPPTLNANIIPTETPSLQFVPPT